MQAQNMSSSRPPEKAEAVLQAPQQAHKDRMTGLRGAHRKPTARVAEGLRLVGKVMTMKKLLYDL